MGAERRTRWTTDHGDKPLGSKFHVYCADDEQHDIRTRFAEYPVEKRLGATGEFVFVLRPESDHAAWLALREYANAVYERDPQLAGAIFDQVSRIRRSQP